MYLTIHQLSNKEVDVITIFGNYAKYYDLLYSDKDYSSEARFAAQTIKRYSPRAKHILEFGCGTGIHAEHMETFGYHIHGIDISPEMIECATARCRQSNAYTQGRLSFEHCDLKNYIASIKYDVVMSLFHVMSYQTTNEDLINAFRTARKCLDVGGLFFFDCWHGPAVLHQKPTERLKRVQDDNIQVLRYARPLIDERSNLVTVVYSIIGIDKKLYKIEEFDEEHRVRYFFQSELELVAAFTGFSLVSIGEWMTDAIPSANTWGVYYVFKAK